MRMALRAWKAANALGGYRLFPPAGGAARRRRGGTFPMGFRPAPQAAGRRERSDRRVGGSVFAMSQRLAHDSL